MINFDDLEIVLNKYSVSAENQELVHDFLSHFSFPERQRLFGIFLNFPEKINLFIDLIKKKMELAKDPNTELSKEILNLESKEISSLIGNLQ